MSAEPARLSVRILEKDYFVACPPAERNDLLESAALLNGRMKEIRDTAKVVGIDRIAVMAALNLANEVLKLRQHDHDKSTTGDTGRRLKNLRERVELALDKGQQLEL